MRFRPSFRWVDSTLRSAPNLCFRFEDRNSIAIFIHRSCPARLFVKGTAESVRKRSIESLRQLGYNTRLCLRQPFYGCRLRIAVQPNQPSPPHE